MNVFDDSRVRLYDAIADLQSRLTAAETRVKELETKSSFDDALKIAVGCLDYGGGHHSDGHLEAFHHGIETVIRALKSVAATGFDTQSRALHSIGRTELDKLKGTK